jgi:hypothetical protein
MRSRSPLLSAIAVAFLATACVHAGDPGVAIENIEADVVFGIEEPEPAVPANTNPGPIPDAALDTGFDMSRFHNPAADRLPSLDTVATEEACPKAPPTAAAERPTEATITGAPIEGVYLWQRSGTQIVPSPDGADPVTKVISGFERRIIRNVQPFEDSFDPDAYTFEMVQTLIDRPVVQVRTFLVKPNSSAQAAPDLGSNSPIVDEPEVHEPEGGVSVIKIEEFGENDARLGSFEPATGLLLLTLPVSPTLEFESVAVDPKTGQTIVQDAHVRSRKRIDACGELVDGWRVETTQTRTDIVGEVTYNVLIATQYGGAPILEEISTVGVDGVETNVTYTLGQVTPDPLESA